VKVRPGRPQTGAVAPFAGEARLPLLVVNPRVYPVEAFGGGRLSALGALVRVAMRGGCRTRWMMCHALIWHLLGKCGGFVAKCDRQC
jgi:hypothetical protein